MSQPNFAEFDVHNVGWVTYGGAPTAPDVIGRLRTLVPERPPRQRLRAHRDLVGVDFLPDEYAELRPETVGFAAPPVEVDLLDPDPTSGVGELLIRGQNVVAGYWNKPEQTAETFVDGWLHTGDLARVDDEGFVQIVDRLKDMVNRGGENVYCVEVENALVAAPRRVRGRRARRARRDDGREGRRGHRAAAGHGARRAGDPRLRQGAHRRLQGAAVRRHSAPSRCRATPAARCSSRCCARRPSGASNSADAGRSVFRTLLDDCRRARCSTADRPPPTPCTTRRTARRTGPVRAAASSPAEW